MLRSNLFMQDTRIITSSHFLTMRAFWAFKKFYSNQNQRIFLTSLFATYVCSRGTRKGWKFIVLLQ